MLSWIPAFAGMTKLNPTNIQGGIGGDRKETPVYED
jgi:hypothetical protein